MSAVQDVRDYLGSLGIVDSSGWPSFRRMRSDVVPDEMVVVSEDGGQEPEPPAEEGIGDSAMAFPGVLITVRAAPAKGEVSFDKAAEILNALHGLNGRFLGGTYYLAVRTLTSEPVFAGYDDNNRPLHTVAARLTREQLAPTL